MTPLKTPNPRKLKVIAFKSDKYKNTERAMGGRGFLLWIESGHGSIPFKSLGSFVGNEKELKAYVKRKFDREVVFEE